MQVLITIEGISIRVPLLPSISASPDRLGERADQVEAERASGRGCALASSSRVSLFLVARICRPSSDHARMLFLARWLTSCSIPAVDQPAFGG